MPPPENGNRAVADPIPAGLGLARPRLAKPRQNLPNPALTAYQPRSGPKGAVEPWDGGAILHLPRHVK
jgi:hypothetical protein